MRVVVCWKMVWVGDTSSVCGGDEYGCGGRGGR